MSLETREDLDPVETTEWLESLESVLDREGEDRARYLMTRLADRLRRDGMKVPFSVTTPTVIRSRFIAKRQCRATCSWSVAFVP